MATGQTACNYKGNYWQQDYRSQKVFAPRCWQQDYLLSKNSIFQSSMDIWVNQLFVQNNVYVCKEIHVGVHIFTFLLSILSHQHIWS